MTLFVTVSFFCYWVSVIFVCLRDLLLTNEDEDSLSYAARRASDTQGTMLKLLTGQIPLLITCLIMVFLKCVSRSVVNEFRHSGCPFEYIPSSYCYFKILIVCDWSFTVIQRYPFHPCTIVSKVFINRILRQKLMIIPGV